MMPMMNNPMIREIVMLKQQGTDVNTASRKMAEKYPQFKMVCGKSPKEFYNMLTNMYKERGISIEDTARSLGMTIPSNR